MNTKNNQLRFVELLNPSKFNKKFIICSLCGQNLEKQESVFGNFLPTRSYLHIKSNNIYCFDCHGNMLLADSLGRYVFDEIEKLKK